MTLLNSIVASNKNDQLLQHYRRLATDPERGWGMKAQDVRPQLLMFYAKLQSNQKGITFNIGDTTRGLVDTENLLKKANVMFAHEFGLAIHQVKIDPADPNRRLPGNTPLIFYPDKFLFAGPPIAPGTQNEWQCLEMLYRAKLSLKTDSDVRLEDFPTDGFRSVTEVGESATAHRNQSELVLRDVTSALHFYGDRRTTATIDLPEGDYSAIAGVPGVTENYAVLLLRGFECVNAANNQRVLDYGRTLNNVSI